MIELKQTKQRKSLLVSITKQLNFILLIISGRNQEIFNVFVGGSSKTLQMDFQYSN
jgi:hypothetical protein